MHHHLPPHPHPHTLPPYYDKSHGNHRNSNDGHINPRCHRCSKNFNSPSGLIHHLRNSRKHNVCHLCPPHMFDCDFENPDHLMQHMDAIHYKCHICVETYLRDGKDLVEHMKWVHYLCVLCGSQCRDVREFLSHLAGQHLLKSPLRCACNLPFPTGSLADLLSHVETDLCEAMSAHTSLHAINSLSDVRLLVPPYAGYLYTDTCRTLDSLVRSSLENSSTDGGMSFICNACRETFGTYVGLMRHLAGKIGPGYTGVSFSCPYCRISFFYPSMMVGHIETSHCYTVRPPNLPSLREHLVSRGENNSTSEAGRFDGGGVAGMEDPFTGGGENGVDITAPRPLMSVANGGMKRRGKPQRDGLGSPSPRGRYKGNRKGNLKGGGTGQVENITDSEVIFQGKSRRKAELKEELGRDGNKLNKWMNSGGKENGDGNVNGVGHRQYGGLPYYPVAMPKGMVYHR